MDRINEQIERIQELSSEELEGLKESIVAEFSGLQEQSLTREIADAMTNLGNAAEAVRSEEARRETEATELAAAAEAAAELVNGAPKAEEAEEVVEEDEEETAKKKKKSEDVPVEVTDATFSAEEVTTSVDETPESVASTTEVEEVAPEVSTETELSASQEPLPPVIEADEEVVEEAELEVEEVPADEAEEAEEATEEVVTPEEVSEEAVVSEDVTLDTEEDSEETVTAAANTEGLNIEVPEEHKPVETKVAAPVTITAGADIPGITAGSELPNLRAVAQALLDRKKGMGRTSGGDGEQHTVATFTTTFPEERMLSSHDFEGNSKKVNDVVSPEAIVAAGGFCAPFEPRYEVFGLGDLGRPVRDSLAVFNADRGGIVFVTPPVLTDLNGAVSLWTLQDDIDAATVGGNDPVKPCIRVNCGAKVEAYTDAIPLCLTFGNLGSRTYPEMVERHTQLGMIQHARFAETRLITRIGALSTTVTGTSTPSLGIARDFFVAVEQAAAGYRNRHRMDDEANLRILVPAWLKNALRADLTKQIPGDGDENTFALAEATLNRWFAVRNINVTYFLDGEAGQIIGAQAAGALNAYPTNLLWYLFAEGTFLFLDGGTLDLGIVRDSTLNGTNDYKIFLETFEGLAKVGIESLRVVTPVNIKGASAATA